jgi:hypothetical protein
VHPHLPRAALGLRAVVFFGGATGELRVYSDTAQEGIESVRASSTTGIVKSAAICPLRLSISASISTEYEWSTVDEEPIFPTDDVFSSHLFEAPGPETPPLRGRERWTDVGTNAVILIAVLAGLVCVAGCTILGRFVGSLSLCTPPALRPSRCMRHVVTGGRSAHFCRWQPATVRPGLCFALKLTSELTRGAARSVKDFYSDPEGDKLWIEASMDSHPWQRASFVKGSWRQHLQSVLESISPRRMGLTSPNKVRGSPHLLPPPSPVPPFCAEGLLCGCRGTPSPHQGSRAKSAVGRCGCPAQRSGSDVARCLRVCPIACPRATRSRRTHHRRSGSE